MVALAWDYISSTRPAIFALADLVFNLLTLIKGGVTGCLDLRVVHENIVPAPIGCDKSVSFFPAKPFYCTFTHYYTP
jgi:hypothetical protein